MLTFVGWPWVLKIYCLRASGKCMEFTLQNKSNFLSQRSCLHESMLQIWRFIIAFTFLILVCGHCFSIRDRQHRCRLLINQFLIVSLAQGQQIKLCVLQHVVKLIQFWYVCIVKILGPSGLTCAD